MEIKKAEVQDVNNMLMLWRRIENIDLNMMDDTIEGINKFIKRNNSLSYCVYDKKEIVACIIAGHDGRRGNIYHLAVHKNYRLRGIAANLLKKVYLEFKKQNISKINIKVLAEAEEAQKFWEHMNWKLREDILTYTLEL